MPWCLFRLERFQALGLSHPRDEDASHPKYSRLTKLVGLAAVVVNASTKVVAKTAELPE